MLFLRPTNFGNFPMWAKIAIIAIGSVIVTAAIVVPIVYFRRSGQYLIFPMTDGERGEVIGK